MKKILMCIIVSMFLITLVSAVPPIRTGDSDTGYELKIPPREYLKQNQDFEFEVHIFNETNGVPIIDDGGQGQISCFLHLYNSTGRHQLTMVDLTPSHTFDYGFDVDGGNFSELGMYPIIIQCNSSTQGGYSVETMEVTPTGVQNLNFYLIILILSGVVILFGFAIKDAWITVLGTFGLYFVGLYTLINGIDIIKNTTYTYAISIILLGLAAYISVTAAAEKLSD